MKRKTIFIILVSMFLATLLVFGFTNARYSYSANTKGNMDLLQTKCSLELYNPSSVTGSTSGATYKTENGTSYFAVPSIPTDYTNINYKVNNKVSNVINQKEIQYYIRVVAEDGSTNMPIEYNVHKYNDASSKYSLVSGWGYGPFTLQKNTEYSGTNGMFSIEAKYTSTDSKYMNSVQKMKVQVVTKKTSGSLVVLSEAPLYMELVDKTPPTISAFNVSKVTNGTISVSVSATDSESGIKNYAFYLDTSLKSTQTSASYTYGGVTAGTSYTLKVVVTDNAGNSSESIKHIYKITYNLNGGANNSSNPTEYVEGSTLSLNQPTRVEYTFTGWTGSNGTTTQKDIQNASYNGELNFTANWQINSYTLTVKASNSHGTVSGESSGSKVYNKQMTVTATPKSGYKFIGWTDGTNTVSTNTSYTFKMPAKDYQLVANFILGSVENGEIIPFDDNITYIVVKERKTWKDAESYAQSLGGHLARIDSKEKNDLLCSKVSSIGSTWIGLTDEVTEGTWRWCWGGDIAGYSSGVGVFSGWKYQNWSSGEPSGVNHIEDYGQIIFSIGKWNDLNNVGDLDPNNTAYYIKGFIVEVHNNE